MPDIETAYQLALDYLYSFVDYSLTRNLRYSPEKFDLGRMVEFMKRLGDPHRAYPVIHVAGTKGKGSTAAMMASVLRAAGYRTGFYTSPHLQEYTERIQVDGCEIGKEQLVDLVDFVKPIVAGIKRLTTFEITTALAFLFFERQKVDVAVVEVGLGGRLDATNIVTPLVSVITSLSLDHMNVLGDTLDKIAFEKAGIIKPGRPVVLAPQVEVARTVVEQIANERQSRLILVGRDYLFTALDHSFENQTFEIWPVPDQSSIDSHARPALPGVPGTEKQSQSQATRLTIPLLGFHQVENAATAYTALMIARQDGLAIPDEAVARGMAAVNWPGRFEILSRQPLLVVDSAHNRDSALKLRRTIDEYLPDVPIVLIFGASEDKDVSGMFIELLPSVTQVIATQSVHPRAMNADKLVELAHQMGKPAQAVLPVALALEKAIDLAGQEGAVVVAGSLFVAATVRETWQRIK